MAPVDKALPSGKVCFHLHAASGMHIPFHERDTAYQPVCPAIPADKGNDHQQEKLVQWKNGGNKKG
jgi:hypothetical protein